MTNDIKGKIHSFQSLGTVDGPGIRFVVFMQGCPLRCGCCHNPDTWAFDGGNEFSPSQIIEKALRFKSYFGKNGGITVSGGEPLVQTEFVSRLFKLAHDNDINTCLDTSGYILNDKIKALLQHTDRVLLDVKYTDKELYFKHVGCSLNSVLEFLDYCNKNGIPVTLRQVIIPTLNDNEQNVKFLNDLANAHACIDKIELLPFKKICQVKYDQMNLTFPFKDFPTPTGEIMTTLNSLLIKK